jgi:hypothetical protein
LALIRFMWLSSMKAAHVDACLAPRAGNPGHLARFSRDVGFHGSLPLTFDPSATLNDQ